MRQDKLLEETQSLMAEVQAQAETLYDQQQVLKQTNRELEERTEILRKSEEQLQQQQVVLEELNMELEEKTEHLEKQNKKYEAKNKELEKARNELELKAKELAKSSMYKSQFSANMSHELRTPLNSMIILSNKLAENNEDTLTEQQITFAKTIHDSGKYLLTLINDILDLSKIEAGKMTIQVTDVPLKETLANLDKSFRPLAGEKGLQFELVLDKDMPEIVWSDQAKLLQILKNLLANAFKFTEKGKVSMAVFSEKDHDGKNRLHFAVKDTGIGAAPENHELIFEDFQQEDGSISRDLGERGSVYRSVNSWWNFLEEKLSLTVKLVKEVHLLLYSTLTKMRMKRMVSEHN